MDNRAFPRIDADIFTRFLINGDLPGEGIARDISGGGIAIISKTQPAKGDAIVAHLNGGARLEGIVARVFRGGFALELKISERRRERLLDSLDPLVDNEDLPVTSLTIDRRLTERVDGMKVETQCITERGPVSCRIVDMSLTGAAIRTNGYIRVGSKVTLGQTAGIVIRRDGQIYGLQFSRPEETAKAEPEYNAPEETSDRPKRRGVHAAPQPVRVVKSA